MAADLRFHLSNQAVECRVSGFAGAAYDVCQVRRRREARADDFHFRPDMAVAQKRDAEPSEQTRYYSGVVV